MPALPPPRLARPSRGAIAASLACVLIPLWFNPARLAGHEPHRAGLLAALVAFALPDLLPRHIDRRARPLLWALAAWCAAWVASAALAIAPAQSLFGDLFRAMGAGTGLALAAALLLGRFLTPTSGAHGFWLAGAAVAAFSLLQTTGLLPDPDRHPERVAGLLGTVTTTGAWLMLAILWTLPRWRIRRGPAARLAFWGVLAGMGAALILTGARGPALGLAAGLLTALLIGLAQTRQRRLALIGLGAALALAGGGLLLARVPAMPLLSRLNDADSTIAVRATLWEAARAFDADGWPLAAIDGWPIPTPGLRRWFGYGPDAIEPIIGAISPPLPRAERIDRMHSTPYDLLLMTGWIGLAAWVALLLAAGLAALRRLRLAGALPLALIGAGGLVGALALWGTAYVPLAACAGLIGGLWLALLATAFGQAPAADDPRAALALIVLCAHALESQFIFPTLANTLPVMLAFGLLLTPEAETAPPEEAMIAPRRMGGMAALILLRGGVGALAAPGLLAVAGAALTTASEAAASVTLALGAALIDAALLIGLLALAYGRRLGVWAGAALAVVLIAWSLSAASDMAIRAAVAARSPGEQVAGAAFAAALRPWEYRLWTTAGCYAQYAGQGGLSEALLAPARALHPPGVGC